MTKKERLLKNIEASKSRSAWRKGVKLYAYELVEEMDNADLERLINNIPELSFKQFRSQLETLLLSGADDWMRYSWGGRSLVYNGDIAERLCTPAELKKVENGAKRPSKSEDWMDLQARALIQAYELVYDELVFIA